MSRVAKLVPSLRFVAYAYINFITLAYSGMSCISMNMSTLPRNRPCHQERLTVRDTIFVQRHSM